MFGRFKNLAIGRAISSYSVVQAATGNLIRNRGFQATRPRVRTLTYVDIGAGLNTHDDFINIDFQWHPKIDLCWDITRGLPFKSQSMDGIFSEHCLEHFPLETALSILKECHRILRSGHAMRIVVPDAEIYLRTYVKQIDGDQTTTFPYAGNTAFRGISSPILDVNRIFYQDRDSRYGHWFIYDFAFLRDILRLAGFTDARRVSFGEGSDKKLLIDAESRACESLYVEAKA